MLIFPKINCNTPLVSIIMTCYNEEKTISKSIESLLYQTYKNIEIIIVDDGSTDNTVSILKDYDLKYEHIRVIYNEVNKGCYNCKNQAIEYINGLYTTFQDADDISHPRRIELCVNFCLKYNLLFCNILQNRSSSLININNYFNKMKKNYNKLFNITRITDLILKSNIDIPLIGLFIRTEIFGIVGNYDLRVYGLTNQYSCDRFFEYKILHKILHETIDTKKILNIYFLSLKSNTKIENIKHLYLENGFGLISSILYFSYNKTNGLTNKYSKNRIQIRKTYINNIEKGINPECIKNLHIKQLLSNIINNNCDK
jgi:glycosyltransferase involved in cell wall biosynthesis